MVQFSESAHCRPNRPRRLPAAPDAERQAEPVQLYPLEEHDTKLLREAVRRLPLVSLVAAPLEPHDVWERLGDRTRSWILRQACFRLPGECPDELTLRRGSQARWPQR